MPNLKWVVAMILMATTLNCKQNQEVSNMEADLEQETDQMQIAHLRANDQAAFQQLRSTFKDRNPGYDISYYSTVDKIPAASNDQVVFIQEGGGKASISSGINSKFSVGDIILLDQGIELQSDSLFTSLVFTVPETLPEDIPRFIRPDWDPNITDIPGGCATETNAYRRILLTWQDKVGPYQYHALNAHRVRIMDSFSHYHPKIGGFDEFYLVQMVQPNAKIITSSKLDLLLDQSKLGKEDLGDLFQSTKLEVGDLVYLPRGVIHRGLDGVLAQVITIPGFVPKSEIGVDHLIRQINARFSLMGADSLPYNVSASDAPVVK